MTCPTSLHGISKWRPDLRVFCCCYGLEGKSDDEIRDAMSDRFPKHIYACRISQSPSATRKAMKKSGLATRLMPRPQLRPAHVGCRDPDDGIRRLHDRWRVR